MAKITSLAELTDVASDDLLVVVDKSDTSMADSGTDKKVKKSSLAKSLLDFFYPVGTIYETTSSDLDTTTKMNNHFGGTWEVYGAGRVLVAKSADTEFNTLGKTGGSKYLQQHKHGLRVTLNMTQVAGDERALVAGGGSAWSINDTYQMTNVGDGTSGNLQPYIVVFRYRRTA